MLTCTFLMQQRDRLLNAVLLCACATLAHAESASRVHTLDEVPKVGSSKQSPEQYRAQLKANLLEQRNKLGTQLPPGWQPNTILNLIAPEQKLALATLIGVKAWPYRANSYVAIACIAISKAAFDEDRRLHKDEASCGVNKQGKFDKRVYLALLEYKDSAPRLLASSGKPLALKVSWQASNLQRPSSQGHDSMTSAFMPEEILSFDFAPYKITANDTAIGLRLGWQDDEAKGRSMYEALALFAINGDKLENILAEPIYYYSTIAKASNGEQEVREIQNLLSILPSKTQDHFDLKMRTLNGKWKQVFVWQESNKRYVADNMR